MLRSSPVRNPFKSLLSSLWTVSPLRMSSPSPSTNAAAGPSTSRRSPSPRPAANPSPEIPLSSLPPPGTPIHAKPSGWDFYRNVMRSPKYIVAPMVSASELPWRLLSREFGADLCYSPMINSRSLSDCLKAKGKNAKAKQRAWFDVETGEEGHDGDRMLVAQVAGHDPDVILQSAQHVEDHCLAVDLNLGCPQKIAKRGFYGSFLQEDWQLIFKIINTLHVNLKVPVTAKMRVFPDVETTVAYAKLLQYAGAQIVTVHGRTREQKGHKTGLADWAKIRAVKEALDVPVFANGNILYGEDLADALEKTGADGVMSAEGNLYTPTIFSSPEIRARHGKDVFPYHGDEAHPEWAALPYIPRIADMYLDYVVKCKTKTSPVAIKGHMFKLCKPALDKHRDLMIKIGQAKVLGNVNEGATDEAREESIKEYREAVRAIDERLKSDQADPAHLKPTESQSSLPPEYHFVPHWLCQPYFRPPLQDSTRGGRDDSKANTEAGMVDPADEQSRGEKRALGGDASGDLTPEQKKIRLQGQLREAEELKQQGNALFARKECEEACERWVDAIGALPAVDSAGDATDATDPASDPPPPQQQLAELTDEEAQAMQAEMDDPHLGALKELQRREQELRATLWSNVAEGRLRLSQWSAAKEAADNALATTPHHLKSLSRRATANEHLGTSTSLSDALTDLKAVTKHADLPASQRPTVTASLSRVESKLQEAMQREKDEMLGKLKGLGDTLLGKFGLSTDNFKFEQNAQGGWGMKFQR